MKIRKTTPRNIKSRFKAPTSQPRCNFIAVLSFIWPPLDANLVRLGIIMRNRVRILVTFKSNHVFIKIISSCCSECFRMSNPFLNINGGRKNRRRISIYRCSCELFLDFIDWTEMEIVRFQIIINVIIYTIHSNNNKYFNENI